ncbi:UDP-phosphate galactose phosphotransferase [Sporosarcina sp. P20a]|uniref:sugar transferase n=1 Tax=Sporosarcina sp. P20a TaxID=2048256 RepID=UPI000C16EFC6|nr:sugar transferase [Sporosarcina sp. P20a]PIC85454.1 UDP-phosphate galactose phosphotransferase [Sporosarcina sp. P20a]
MYSEIIKRFLDILFSIILMPLILIIIIVCAIAIKIEDQGSVFYAALRLGKDEKTYKMYKLRTMKENAPDLRNEDGSTYNSDKDVRVTKVGSFLRKTSIDEIPQIINVLLGNMSFIGPRPDLPEHILQYSDSEIKKLKVLPGITGYNQAYYRNTIQWKERLINDVYYVNNISFMFDLKILLKTISTILLRKGVFIESDNKNTEGGKNE